MATKTYIYTISNSNGRNGPAWRTEYSSADSAATAIQRAYGWDCHVIGPWFEDWAGPWFEDRAGESCHVAATQDALDRDENGESPWITRVAEAESDDADSEG